MTREEQQIQEKTRFSTKVREESVETIYTISFSLKLLTKIHGTSSQSQYEISISG